MKSRTVSRDLKAAPNSTVDIRQNHSSNCSTRVSCTSLQAPLCTKVRNPASPFSPNQALRPASICYSATTIRPLPLPLSTYNFVWYIRVFSELCWSRARSLTPRAGPDNNFPIPARGSFAVIKCVFSAHLETIPIEPLQATCKNESREYNATNLEIKQELSVDSSARRRSRFVLVAMIGCWAVDHAQRRSLTRGNLPMANGPQLTPTDR